MRRPTRALLLCAALLCGLTACTTTLDVHTQYVSAGVAQPSATGHAAIAMAPADRHKIFSGHPTSFTGGGTSVTVPLGAVVSSVGEKVCSAYFSAGATDGDPTPGDYVVAVVPGEFSYKYDQLSSLGFAVTPRVTVALTIGIKGPSGEAIAPEKTFKRTDFSATGPYAMTLNPAELINQSLHVAVADIYREALDQIPKR